MRPSARISPDAFDLDDAHEAVVRRGESIRDGGAARPHRGLVPPVDVHWQALLHHRGDFLLNRSLVFADYQALELDE